MTDKGIFDKVKGNVKEAAGNLTGDDKLKAEGFLDKAEGKAKELISEAKDKAEDVIDELKEKFDK